MKIWIYTDSYKSSTFTWSNKTLYDSLMISYIYNVHSQNINYRNLSNAVLKLETSVATLLEIEGCEQIFTFLNLCMCIIYIELNK
jgi:hypothetical protein